MTPRAIACARVDAHAHLHPRFDPAVFLDHAHRNAGGTPVLCLTECAGVDRFAELRDTGAAGPWTVVPTDEPESLIAAEGDRRAVLIAGRQIITAERLELLSLATRASIPDGQPIDAAIDAALAADAIPVLPWAFGKWWGRRAAHAERALSRRTDVCLGDQAGRPRSAPEHRFLTLARERTIPVLPGSDPLDLPHHVARPADYGFTFEGASATFELDARRPAAGLRDRIGSLRGSPQVLGERVALPAFVRDQIALRLFKRRNPAP